MTIDWMSVCYCNSWLCNFLNSSQACINFLPLIRLRATKKSMSLFHGLKSFVSNIKLAFIRGIRAFEGGILKHGQAWNLIPLTIDIIALWKISSASLSLNLLLFCCYVFSAFCIVLLMLLISSWMSDLRLDFSFKSHDESSDFCKFALLPLRKPKASRTLITILSVEPMQRNLSVCLFWLARESSTTSSIESSYIIVGTVGSTLTKRKTNRTYHLLLRYFCAP
jgi:hypothetical protein